MDPIYVDLLFSTFGHKLRPPLPPGPQVLKVPGFESFGGAHCETSALQKVLAFHGLNYSEALLFGVGGGIGFVCWRFGRQPLPFIGGRNGRFPTFLKRAGQALGQRLTFLQTRDRQRGYQLLCEQLQDGKPVICYGDIHYLPYFNVSSHFGGHAFIVYELDEIQQTALISDRSQVARAVPLDVLAQARDSDTKVFPPKHTVIQIDVDPHACLTERALWRAIERCYQALRQPLFAGLGLKGILTYRGFLRESAAAMPGALLIELLLGSYISLELAGTGGCAFRKMYRQFLQEAQERLGVTDLTDALAALDRSVAIWERFISGLLTADDSLSELLRCLQAKERIFESAPDSELAAGAELLREIEQRLPEAQEAVGRQRQQIGALADALTAIHAAESDLCTALQTAVRQHRPSLLRRIFS